MPKLSPLRMFGFGVKSQSSECNESVENPVQDGHGLRSKGVGIVPLSEKNVDGTPERRPLAPQNPKARLLKATREQPVDETRSDTSETRSEQSTPTRRHYSVQQMNKHGGASQFSTPRGTRIENRYTLMYSEPNNSAQVPTGTPKKSVRSLKYEQDAPVRAQGGGAVTTLGFPRGKHVDSGAPVQFDLEEDLSFWQDHNVQVLIRVRPISELEVSLQGPGRCLRQDSPHSLTWCGQPESRFTFDHVACETISQEKLFRVAGLPMVENCISGYNNCMFAYGQTGSGKTHTMLGDIADLDQEPSEGRGMIPRVFEYLFVKIQLEKEARKAEGLQFICKCSFLEIYNEQVSDLLEPSFTNLQLREDVKKGVYVENLTEVEVKSVQDVIKLLLQGSANRKVAATNMNRESSRSHSVFTCVVESKWETDSVINTRFGRLNLVDLAGSERQKSSGAEGDRLKEAANINKSLSTLGLVIMVLVDAANGKARHVPYRDSKLTFLLQDSLGGNSKTMIIATVSPSSSCALETLSTLKFAQRAKFIRNNAIVNEDSFGDVFSLRQQIHQLKEEINQLRNLELRKSRNDENDSVVVNHVSHDTLRDSMRREIAAESVIKNLQEEITHLKRLVKQREDDTRRVKMLLRFREDRIRRMEATAVGSLTAAECNTEEKEALQEEVKLLGCRIEHNPEITRFAMENIRLMDELKRFQSFYDHGEREIMSTEISNLRDQLLEVLEENAALKDECGVSSHCTLISENEKLRLEVCQTQDLIGRLKDLQSENEELVRQNLELRAQMAATLEENGDHKREMELNNVKVKSLKMDQDAQLSTIAGLKQLLQQSEETISCGAENSARLELQLSEAQRELEDLRAHMKDAKEVQEQMEYQQLLLINELESALLEKQEAADNTRNVSVLKTQLQTLQLELQKKDEVRALEKQIESADNEEKLRLQGELVKTKQELDDAQELNRLFYREKVRRLSLEKRMDETRTQVEAETANTIASMQSELLLVNDEVLSANKQIEEATTKAAKLADEIEALQAENARLTTVCEALNKDKDLEAQELHTVLQQACSRLLQHLSEGDRTLEAAVEQIEQAPLSSQLMPELGEKRSAVEVLQLILKQAFSIVKDAELKMQALNATALQMSEIQKQQDEEIRKAAERANGIERALELSERKAHAAFLVIRHCADFEHGLRTEKATLASVNSEQQNGLSALRATLTSKSRALEKIEFSLRDAWEELIVQEITSDAEVKQRLELGEEWTGRLAAAEAQLQHHLQQASGLEEELASTRLALEESLNKQMAGANEIFELKEEFSKLRLSANVERLHFQAAKSDLESKNATLALDLKREEDKRDMLEKDCMAALAEMNDLDIKVQQLDDHIGMLEEVNGSLKAENEALKHAFEDLKHDSEVMQTELREKLLLLEDEVGRKDAAFQNLERSLLETKENADREAAELHEEISSRARAKEAEILNLRQELSLAVTQANAMEMELRDLRELHASIVEENATLKSDIQDIECEFRSRENQMNETFDVMENMQLESDAELKKHKAIISALEGQILDLQDAAEAARAMETEQECTISHLREEISKKESVLKGLEFDMGVLQESFAAATAKKAEALECQSGLQHQLTSRLNDLAHVEGLLNNLRKEVSESTDTLQLMEVELRGIKDQNAELSVQNISLKRKIEELELEKTSLQGQFDDKAHLARMLELELFEVSSLVEQKIAESIAGLNNELNAVIKERDQLQADLLVSTEQLDMAQSLAEEREIVAAEARQIAEVSKARAEEKEEEIKVLERSVEELESIINALENQVGIVKREAQMHRMGREDLESEIQSLKREISVRQQMIEANSVAEETNVLLNEEVARLNEDCAEKEAQIQAYTKHLADLMSSSTTQASQFQQKINELETTIDQLKSKAKGSGSPFKCIGLGLSQQMSSELDEELSAARRRISELETVAAGRQREVFMLNAKLAEAESMTHDVVRDLLNVKVDISNYASLLSHEQSHQKPPSSPGAKEEIGRLNKQLEAYIEERDSCLEQMSQRQAELVAIRLGSDKLRSREQALANENEKLKDDLKAFKKQQVDLESEIRKLSGQQNLQQRIHHHAKIKEENNTLKLRNEELSARLRHTETRLNRVSEELTRHRSAKGMPELEVEERLRSKMKEAEEDNMQMAQELANICKAVMQVAGVGSDTSIDPSVAIAALQNLDEQLTDTQKQLADLNDKVAELERRE